MHAVDFVTNAWLKDLMERLGWKDRHRAYFALRVVPHELRDHLNVQRGGRARRSAADAGPRLLLRRVEAGGQTAEGRSHEAFLSHISAAFRDPDIDVEQVTRAVFHVLGDHLTTGEVEGVKHCLPKDVRALWV
jgi:uncharacterized protein (DUF2267 family)